jgi:hypothetical protein
MFSPDSREMYVAAGILFLLPTSLLFFSWLSFHRAKSTTPLPGWRKSLFYAALLGAAVSTALNIVWNASWLRNGGSPNGMGAAPGMWQHVGPFLVWSFQAATLLGFFGKRKARILMLAWSFSMLLVFQFIYVLQFD